MAKTIKRYSKIALVLGLSIAVVALLVNTPYVEAYTFLSSREVKISDSRPDTSGIYYDFEANGSTTVNINCIKIEFCTNTTVGSCTNDSSDWNSAVNNATTTATTTGFDWDDTNLNATNWVIYSTSSNSVVASSTNNGTGEAFGTGGSFVIGNLTNPSTSTVYYAHVRTYSDADCSDLSTEIDRGVIGFAVISGVTVSATVAETLTVAVNASTCDSLISGGSNVASATTSIGFGTVSSESFYNSCQRIDVGTNAGNGYTATVRKTQLLTSGSDTIPNGNCDGGCASTTAATWGTATNNGFAYCMKDSVLNASAVADTEWTTEYCGGGSQGFMLIDDNEPSEATAIMQSGTATSTNQSYIGYRLSVDSAQAAGTYSTTIIYVVTPNY